MTTGEERGLWLPDVVQRRDLAAFAERAQRLDEAAVIRLRQRSEGVVVAWAATGFDVLASRVVGGSVRPGDVSTGADALLRGLASSGPSGNVDLGFPMDSAWRGALPPESGFVHVDDVPAVEVLELARQGADLSAGSHGPPTSLLDQEVIQVSGAGIILGVPMRCVFALSAMGFVDPDAADDIVRVRTLATWLRIDARYGSVYRQRDLLRLL